MTGQWRTTLLAAGSTIQEAIRNLNQSGLQISLVVDGSDRLVGTVTDGDIRRGLLRGLTLESPVAEIVHNDPLVIPPGLAETSVMDLMRANKIHQLPIVDEQRRVVGLHVWDELTATRARTNTMVIMAGGKGTRLMPHTENCPKPLLPVAGKPMLEHIIERAQMEGFQRFVIAIHYLGHMISDHFGDGSKWGVAIDYLTENEPLGTGGALSLLQPIPDEPFLVTNGDVLTDVRYGEILDYHNRHRAMGTMAVRAHEWQHPFGVVRTKGVDIVGYHEKPVHRTQVNAGIYVIEPRALALLEQGQHCDMPTLFERIRASDERVIVYPMHEPWLDVGRPDDLQRAENERSA